MLSVQTSSLKQAMASDGNIACQKIKHIPTARKAVTSSLQTRVEWMEKGNKESNNWKGEKRVFSNAFFNIIKERCWKEYKIDGSGNVNTT